MYADDTTLYIGGNNHNDLIHRLQSKMYKLLEWLESSKRVRKVYKTELMFIGFTKKKKKTEYY